MSQPNILNLDSLKVIRKVILNGKERSLRSMTVGEFIDAAGVEEALQGKSGTEQITALVEQLMKYMDDTTEDELKGMEIEQLLALMQFVRGTDVAANGQPQGKKKGRK